jgi:O-antigen ligase
VLTQGPITQIFLTPEWLALLFGVMGISIVRARPEWLLGLYLSISLWTRTVMVGPVSATWVVLAALLIASWQYMHRERRFIFTPEHLRDRDLGWTPKDGRGIVIWMLVWWGWMLFVLFQFHASSKVGVLRPLLLNIILPTPLMLLIASDLDRVRRFALAYVATSAIGCWYALQIYGIGFEYLLTDPTLDNSGLIRLGISNYHFFSHFCAISAILSIALYIEARSWIKQVLFVVLAAWFAYFLLLAGARQSMSGAAIAALLFLAWMVLRGGLRMSMRGVVLGALLLIVVLWLYQISPDLIIRSDEASLNESFNIAERGKYWEAGWNFFLSSPIWGLGFEQTVWSHNLFIGTLSDQGLIGFIFFIGFLVFVLKRIPDVWIHSDHDERAPWRMAFLAIFLFAMIHGQASGNTSLTAHLYWSCAGLWWLVQGVRSQVPQQRQVGAAALQSQLPNPR